MKRTVEQRFGARVRTLRLDRDWTQEDLCGHTGIGREHISRIENGHKEVCLNIIQTLSRAFGVSISELTRGV